jgi:quercetin dioxygenase-like cupin family protein
MGAPLTTTAVAFDLGDWVEESPGVRACAREEAGARWAIVEYAPGASRPDWCTVPHHAYVLEGAIDYDIRGGGSVTARAGQGLQLGTDDAHRGINRGSVAARLLVIDLEG